MPKKLNTETFKQQLSIEHPELELLSEYNGNKNYVTVRCMIHNHIFQTKPNWLHKGSGCQKCYDERRGKNTRKGTEKFIEESRKIHSNKYDYSKVDYVNNRTKVKIICPIHGEFLISPEKHLSRKQGCPKCANKHVTTEEFIEKARKKHGDKYDYSKVVYIKNTIKVCFICPEHGEFWQTPDDHLQGKGCPHCRTSKLELLVKDTLNDIGVRIEQQKKFEWLGKQSLDFYVPDHNIAIECQGEQHFKQYTYFGGREGFERTLKRDITKHSLCEENGLKLYYVIDRKMSENIKKKIFLNIYNNKNVIFLNDIERIKNIIR